MAHTLRFAPCTCLGVLIALVSASVAAANPSSACAVDAVIDTSQALFGNPVVATADGTLIVARTREIPGANEIVLHKSIDGGDTWSQWTTLPHPPGTSDASPVLILASESRLLMAWVRTDGANQQAWTGFTDPHAMFPAWTTSQRTEHGTSVNWVHMTTTARYEDPYAVLLASTNVNATSYLISRSATRGESWGPSYSLHSVATDLTLGVILLESGPLGVVHAVWSQRDPNTEIDRETYYARAVNYGVNGLTDWSAHVALTTAADSLSMLPYGIASSGIDDTVLLALGTGASPNIIAATTMRASFDAGITWDPADSLGIPAFLLPTLAAYPDGSGFAMAGFDATTFQHALVRAAQPNVLSWSAPLQCSDGPAFVSGGSFPRSWVVVHPTLANQLGMAWTVSRAVPDPDSLFFDAEWMAQPGFPRHARLLSLVSVPSFTAELMLVELDGDAEQEFMVGLGASIVAYDHDLTPVSGWPNVTLPGGDEPATLASGDLDGDGWPEIVVGSVMGWVHVYDRQGNPIPGYPVDLGTSGPAFVCVAPMLNSLSNQVIATSLNYLSVLSFGSNIPGYPVALPTSFVWQPAVGDVDGDERNDIVMAGATTLHIRTPDGVSLLDQELGLFPTGAPALADIENDGDLEVAVPTLSGVALLHHTGAGYGGGWPVGTGASVRSVAFSQLIGSLNPDVVAVTSNGDTYLFSHDGTLAPSWPQNNGETDQYGAAIVENLNSASSQVVLASPGLTVQAWTHASGPLGFWPKSLPGFGVLTPASGDLDNDGCVELLVLSEIGFAGAGFVTLVETGGAFDPDPVRRWPMEGGNAARARCLNCSNSPSTTAVAEREAATSSLHLLAYPNPTTGASRIAFQLRAGERARVDLFDISGRRVRRLDAAQGGGRVEVHWDGMDASGHRVSRGVYLARVVTSGGDPTRTATTRLVVFP